MLSKILSKNRNAQGTLYEQYGPKTMGIAGFFEKDGLHMSQSILPPWLIRISWLLAGQFWVMFFILPLGAVFFQTVGGSLLSLILDPGVVAVAKSTVIQSFLSTLISAAMGFPLGLAVGKMLSQKQGTSCLGMLELPFGVPALVAAIAWIGILGRSGVMAQMGIPLDWSYSWKIVILAHVFLNAPLIALQVGLARRQVSQDQLDAATTCGAGWFAQMRMVVWPYVRDPFWMSVSQVFSFCAMSFGIVLLLGGGPPVETLETLIYSQIRFGETGAGEAVGSAFWQLVICWLPWLAVVCWISWDEPLGGSSVVSRSVGDSRFAQSSRARVPRFGSGLAVEKRRSSGWSRAQSAILRKMGSLQMKSFLLAIVASGFVLPYFVLLTYASVGSFFLSLFSGIRRIGGVSSLQPASSVEVLSLEQSAQFLGSVLDSVLVAGLSAFFTLVVAGATVISIVGLPLRLRLRKALILFCGSAGGISVFVLGLGYFSLLGSLTRGAWGSFFMTCALQSVLFFPFAFRICWPLSQSIPRQEIHALQTLGGGLWESFWVVLWPRWKMTLAACFFMVAAASLGELGSVSLFMGDYFIPLPILISRWMQRYHFDQAEGAGAFLLMGCTLLMIFGNRLSRSRSRVVPIELRRERLNRE